MSAKKTFLIACGGTGGHLSPGIALAEGLVARGHAVTLLISHKKVDARLVEKYPHFSFLRIPGAPFSLHPVGFARFVVRQLQGLAFGVGLVRRLRPDGIVGFGGFTTASIILAGFLFRVPIALHEANRVPGRAIRTLGLLAKRVYLPPGIRLSDARAAVTREMGLPVRKEISRESPAAARQQFGLDPQQRMLVVLGGSQGATALNQWAQQEAQTLAFAGTQLYCVTGLGKSTGETRELVSSQGQTVKAIFSPFCDRMGTLISAADLVVTRAGAGTLAELVRCETPAVLIPYPHAADNHQEANARYFAEQGGGIVIPQERVSELTRAVNEILSDATRLQGFRENLQRMDRANSLDLMLDDIEQLASKHPAPSDSLPLPGAKTA